MRVGGLDIYFLILFIFWAPRNLLLWNRTYSRLTVLLWFLKKLREMSYYGIGHFIQTSLNLQTSLNHNRTFAKREYPEMPRGRLHLK